MLMTMQADIIAFLDRPFLLFATLLIGGLIGIAVERFVESQKKAERRLLGWTQAGR